MKVRFKFGIGDFQGTIDQAVYTPTKKGGASYMRKWVLPKYSAPNEELGTITKNITSIWENVSDLFKTDLTTYCQRYFPVYQGGPNPFGRVISNFAMFIVLLYNLADENSGTVDLKNLTYNDIKTLFPEIVNVSAAVENGYLKTIPVFDDLDNDM